MNGRLLTGVFRPGVMLGVLIALVGAAALVVFQPEAGQGKPQPAPVRADEQEIAFLYPATSNTAWERFVSAVERSRNRLQDVYPGLDVERAGRPALGQAVPEAALTWPGGAGRLVFRWYKLTSDWSPQAWTDALLARTPPPLAIVGGNSSYWGRELALATARAAETLPEADRPLLLLTMATADRVAVPDSEKAESAAAPRWGEERRIELSKLYPGRTFRICFTNRQMATAVTRFIWSRSDLRPDSDPAYITKWLDDAYSKDLVDGYIEAGRVLDHRGAENLVQQWALVLGAVGLAAHPASLAGCYTGSSFYHVGNEPLWIDSSVGSFAAPNPYEANQVQVLLSKMKGGAGSGGAGFPGPAPEGTSAAGPGKTMGQRRPLLVVTGQAQPSRRFLRELARSAPKTARRFVVALGDTVSFNAIYRDRLVTWPIQDLPFETVLFCHRNPMDPEAGFRPLQAKEPGSLRSISGTEDLLLFCDIVEALGLAYLREGSACASANQLAEGLFEVYQDEGKLNAEYRGSPLFRDDGQRNGGTGEHVVYLRPRLDGDRVLPEAVIEVWSRETNGELSHIWNPQGKPLTVSYDEFKVHGDRSHGGD